MLIHIGIKRSILYIFIYLGEADPKVQKISGLKNYNIKITLSSPVEEDQKDKSEEVPSNGEIALHIFFYFLFWKNKLDQRDVGIIYDEGRKCSMKGVAGVSSLQKITEEEMEEILNDCDPIEAPPGPYTVQPGKKGRKSVNMKY